MLRARRIEDPDILLRRDAAQMLSGEAQAFLLGLPVLVPGSVLAILFTLVRKRSRRIPK